MAIDYAQAPPFGGPPAPPFSYPGNYPQAYQPPMLPPSWLYGPQGQPQALPPPQGQGQMLPPPMPFSQPGNYPGGQGGGMTLQNVQSQNGSGYNNPSGQPAGQGANMAQNQAPGTQTNVTPYSRPQIGGNGQLGQTPSPGDSQTNDQAAGSRFLYNPDDPKLAVWAALKSMGHNPGNPADLVGQMLLHAASGLGQAFNIEHAGAGMNDPAVSDYGNSFKSFLSSALGQGNVFSTLGKASQDLQSSVLPMMRQLGGNSNLSQTNPILQSIMDTALSGGGQGLGNMMLALLGPGMSPGTQQGFAKGLDTAGFNARTAYGNDSINGTGQGKDLWSYLLGI